MSFPRQQFNGMPNYVRQNSYDTSSSHHAPMPTLGYQQSALPPPPPPPHQSRPPRFAPGPSSAVQRNQTVRGAVRGTTREAGANPHLVQRALTRGKTLTRPERFVAPAPLINPGNSSGGAAYTTLVNGVPTLTRNEPFWDPWGIFVNVITFWAPGVLLSAVGLKDKFKQRAWKEKVALCSIAIMLGGVVGFVTIGLTRVLCPVNGTKTASAFTRLGTQAGYVGIEGWNFEATSSTNQAFRGLALNLSGSDVSNAFDRTSIVYPGCAGQTAKFATSSLCGSTTNQTTVSCSLGVLTPALLRNLVLTNASMQVGYDWNQLALFPNYLIIDGNVLNLTPYLLANPLPVPNDVVDTAIRYVLKAMVGAGGKDVTRLFYNRADLTGAVPCLVQRYYAGHIDKVTPGCFISQLFLYVSLVLIMTIVMARFFMAALFSWVLSARLVTAPKNLKRHVISPAVMPEGANIDVDNRTGAAPWTNQAVARQATQKLKRAGRDGGAAMEESKSSDDSYSTEKRQRGGNEAVGANGMISMASIGAELFCVCLVTCYSEGEDSIKTTLDSIAGATYSDARKLLFVVCDGMITGSGEKVSTPDICVAMIEADPRFGEPQALSYVAIGDGSKAHNQAMVYAGHYTSVKGHRTPTIIVVKCGTSLEADEKKPGNRGKRDSQMILMNFFSRVTYNDRMCPLDYDLFRKVQSLMGVTPDFFEVCLMVDADTKIYPESLGYLVRTMQNDNMIMGVCGETRIANKRQSWVTAIQVFEYFISHHLAKAFESVFGGVTCLPGCFSMYRLKARKQNDGDWFPVLVQPQIVSEYSQSVVTTLHQKNLLLLGEDRFLTTLLLRTFPNRKMMFCPQARCRTVAPDTFAVLLSQRRRWINSTVHNLMELVLVRNLCGTFVFSMQFVVFVDLIGTVVLPVAICLTYTLIINYIFNPPASFSDAIPLMLLGAVLGLPAILILITSFKIVYVGWMLIYLIALPIWNFVLPVYAFSKFDDFSWGETRKVEGDVKGEDAHGIGTGTAATVPLRRWEDWERSRLRTAKRRKEFERRFGSKHFYGGGTDGASSYEDSVAPTDSGSMMSHDDDMWGMQIGAYTEDGPTAAPPPVGLYNVEDDQFSAHETIDASDLEAALEQGWAEDPSDEPRLARRSMGNSMGNLMGSSSRGDSYYHTNSGSNTPPAPPKLYSLSDGPFMSSSYSNSSQQALVGNAASYSTSSFAEYAPGPMSPNGSTSSHPVYPQHSTMQMGNYPPGMSTSVSDRNFSGGHAKQRSGSNEMNFERRERGTPSPSRERQFERDAQYHQQQGYGQGEGRRLA